MEIAVQMLVMSYYTANQGIDILIRYVVVVNVFPKKKIV